MKSVLTILQRRWLSIYLGSLTDIIPDRLNIAAKMMIALIISDVNLNCAYDLLIYEVRSRI
jgi:hypothetical protein